MTIATPPDDRSGQHRRLHRDTRRFYSSPFTLVGRLRSLRYAALGVWFVLRSQHNAWLHAMVTLTVLAVAFGLHFGVEPFTPGEWCDLIIAIVLVWVAETFNTGLEVLAAAIAEERHPVVKIAKDVAAAAVLLSAIGAATVGLVLFLPPILTLIRQLIAY